MSYDNPLTISYPMGLIDLGAGDSASAIKPPVGFNRGNVRDIHVAVTETFTQVTTPGYVRVGTTGDPDAFAQLNMGAAAVTDAHNLPASAVKNVIDMSVAGISQLEVVFIAPTGGTPAGIGHVAIVIDWF